MGEHRCQSEQQEQQRDRLEHALDEGWSQDGEEDQDQQQDDQEYMPLAADMRGDDGCCGVRGVPVPLIVPEAVAITVED